MPPPPPAALLLTGGASRRMGRPKATIEVGGEHLATRTARMLRAVAAPVLEVGPGYTDLPAVAEDPPGRGPLAAIAAGAAALRRLGHRGPCLVVATDLPHLSVGLLDVLAGWPGDGSVVPVAGSHPQVLCARYSAAALDLAVDITLDGGTGAVRDLIERVPALRLAPARWAPAAGRPDALVDVDTPDDLVRAGEPGPARPGSGPDR